MSKNKNFSLNTSFITSIFFLINLCKVFKNRLINIAQNYTSQIITNLLPTVLVSLSFLKIRTRSLIFLHKNTYDHYSVLNDLEINNSNLINFLIYSNTKHTFFIKNLSIFLKCNISQYLSFFFKKFKNVCKRIPNYFYILNLIPHLFHNVSRFNSYLFQNLSFLYNTGYIFFNYKFINNISKPISLFWFYLTCRLNKILFSNILYRSNIIKINSTVKDIFSSKKSFRFKIKHWFFNLTNVSASNTIWNNSSPYIIKYVKVLSGFFIFNKNTKFSLIDLLIFNTYTSIYSFNLYDFSSISKSNELNYTGFKYFLFSYKFLTVSNVIAVFNSQYLQNVPLYMFNTLGYISFCNIFLYVRTLSLMFHKIGIMISKTIQFSLKSKRNNSTVSLSTGSGFNFITSSTGVLVSESFLDSKIGMFNNDMPIIALTKITKRSGTLNRSGYMFAGLVRLVARLFWIQDKWHYSNLIKSIYNSTHIRQTKLFLPYVSFHSKQLNPVFSNFNPNFNKNKFIQSIFFIFFIRLKYRKKLLTRKNLKQFRFIMYFFKLTNFFNHNSSLNQHFKNNSQAELVWTTYGKYSEYNAWYNKRVLFRLLNKKFSTFSIRYRKTRFRYYRFRRKYIYLPTLYSWFKHVKIKFQSPSQNNVINFNTTAKFKRFFKRKRYSNDKLSSSVRQIINLFYRSHIISGLSSKNLFPYNREYRFKKYKFRKRKVKRLKFF